MGAAGTGERRIVMSVMAAFDFPTIVVLGVASAAVVFDLRARRIPNALTFSAALAALAYAGLHARWSGVETATVGWAVGAVVFFPFFALGGMGAGDVKLLAALGAWLGPINALLVAMFASIAGGVLALVVALTRGYLSTALSNLWLMLTHWRVSGPGRVPGVTLKDSKSPRLAYAIPIAVGLVCTLWRR